MIFFALGLVLALLGGYIIIGQQQLVFSLIGGTYRGSSTDNICNRKAEALERR